jgi:hypothetical protein
MKRALGKKLRTRRDPSIAVGERTMQIWYPSSTATRHVLAPALER